MKVRAKKPAVMSTEKFVGKINCLYHYVTAEISTIFPI